MKRKILWSIGSIITLLITSSCKSNFKTVDQIVASGKVIVATNAEFAPFEYLEGGTFKGIDIEIIQGYAEHLNIEIVIKDQDFDAALLSISKNKADIAIAAITSNETRQRTMSFSNPYFVANQVAIVKNNSIYSNIETKEELLNALSANKAKIGVQRGTTGEYYVKGDEDWDFPGISKAEVALYDNGALAANALKNGQIDAVIIDIAPANLYVKNFTDLVVLQPILTQEEYAIAVAKGNTTLINSLNEYIDLIKENGKFDEIVSRYYGE